MISYQIIYQTNQLNLFILLTLLHFIFFKKIIIKIMFILIDNK